MKAPRNTGAPGRALALAALLALAAGCGDASNANSEPVPDPDVDDTCVAHVIDAVSVVIEDIGPDDPMGPTPRIDAYSGEQDRIRAVLEKVRLQDARGVSPSVSIPHYARIACMAEPPLVWETPPDENEDEPGRDLPLPLSPEPLPPSDI